MVSDHSPDTKYNKGNNPDMNMNVELVVNDRAQALIVHDRPFTKELSWLEYDLGTSKLDFVMEDGDTRNFGIPVDPRLGKYLQNAHQVLMVLVEGKTSFTKEDIEQADEIYYPLIMHRD